MTKAGFVERLGEEHFRRNIDEALAYAEEIEKNISVGRKKK
jgi:hypothetical protein